MDQHWPPQEIDQTKNQRKSVVPVSNVHPSPSQRSQKPSPPTHVPFRIERRQERLFEVRYFAPPVKDWMKFRKDWTYALKTVQQRPGKRSLGREVVGEGVTAKNCDFSGEKLVYPFLFLGMDKSFIDPGLA